MAILKRVNDSATLVLAKHLVHLGVQLSFCHLECIWIIHPGDEFIENGPHEER